MKSNGDPRVKRPFRQAGGCGRIQSPRTPVAQASSLANQGGGCGLLPRFRRAAKAPLEYPPSVVSKWDSLLGQQQPAHVRRAQAPREQIPKDPHLKQTSEQPINCRYQDLVFATRSAASYFQRPSVIAGLSATCYFYAAKPLEVCAPPYEDDFLQSQSGCRASRQLHYTSCLGNKPSESLALKYR